MHRVAGVILGITLLISCSGSGDSTTGGSTLPVQVYLARDTIRPYYPEAANDLKLVLGDEYEGVYATYSCNGFARLHPLWFDLYAVDQIRAACVIVHEWRHSTQVCTEKGTVWRDIAEAEGYEAQNECVRLLRD